MFHFTRNHSSEKIRQHPLVLSLSKDALRLDGVSGLATCFDRLSTNGD